MISAKITSQLRLTRRSSISSAQFRPLVCLRAVPELAPGGSGILAVAKVWSCVGASNLLPQTPAALYHFSTRRHKPHNITLGFYCCRRHSLSTLITIASTTIPTRDWHDDPRLRAMDGHVGRNGRA
jgi:hypothetical protein